MSSNHNDVFTKEEVDHIRTFPVYEFEVFENMEAAFDPFWDWFLDDYQAKRLPMKEENYDSFQHVDGIPAKDEWLISEIARLICIHAQLCDYYADIFFANGDGLYGHCRSSEDLSARKIAEKTRPISVVIFGNFRLEEISITDSNKDLDFNLLVVNQVPSQRRLPDISILFKYFHAYSGLPNHRDEIGNISYNGSPTLPLQFFEFVLRKRFHLRFTNEAFMIVQWNAYNTYRTFTQEGRIFGDGHPDPMPILQPEHPLPFLSYEPYW